MPKKRINNYSQGSYRNMLREIKSSIIIDIVFLLIFIILGLITHQSLFIGLGGILFAILLLCSLFFHRDPKRNIPMNPELILSPADGRVIQIEDCQCVSFSEKCMKKIAIALSLFDVHVNRIPVNGKINYFEYHAGSYYPALSTRASNMNESMLIGIQNKQGNIFVKQIAGLIARRIVCRLKIGDEVQQGERYGMIKLGSRVELYLPDIVSLRVSTGDKLRGGESIVGEFIHDT